jgi:hypothetical protein
MDRERLQELAGNTPAKLHMRYYDWAAAFFIADTSSELILLGMFYDGTSWIAPYFLIGWGYIMINGWTKIYCPLRRQQEIAIYNESIK